MSILCRVLAAALTAATAAAAETTAPADTITVTGARLSPEAMHDRAVGFIRATGVAAGEVAAARWTDPICPHAVGLNDEPARIVEAKLRAVATDAGITVAPASCTANIAVVFATDGGGIVRDLVAKAPLRFKGMRPAAVKVLEGGAAPIRWWYTSEVRDKDGGRLTSEPPPAFGLTGAGTSAPSIPVNEDSTFVQHYNNSLVSTETIRVLHSATVVVDVTRTDGLPLAAVASYAAMVALAEIRADAAPPDSVLGLFGGGPVLRSPSAWDLAFLHALYRLPLDRTAMRQRGRLVADLVAAQTVP